MAFLGVEGRSRRTSVLSSAQSRLAVATVGLAVAMASPAAAGDKNCSYVPSLLSLADTVLSGREGLGRFQARSYGADAAYLKIRYAPLDVAQATALLDALIEVKVRGAEEIRDALQISAASPDDATTAAAAATRPLSLSAMRAAVLAGAADTVLDLLAREPEADRISEFRDFVVALIDQPDAVKAELAKRAMDKGLPLLAAGLVASERDAAAWKAFVSGIGSQEEVEKLTGFWYWLPAALSNPELPRPWLINSDPVTRVKLHAFTIAMALQPEEGFLNAYLNQTGLLEPTYDASMALRKAIEAGTVATDGTLDAGWLVAYGTLMKEASDTDQLWAGLRGVRTQVGRLGRDNALDMLQWIVAVDAIVPYIEGSVEPPDAPWSLTPEFSADWADWVAAADWVRDGSGAPDESPEGLARRAELLFASGSIDRLVTLLAENGSSEERVKLANDFAKRVDRLCRSYLWHTAEAMLLGGRPVYKFDPN